MPHLPLFSLKFNVIGNQLDTLCQIWPAESEVNWQQSWLKQSESIENDYTFKGGLESVKISSNIRNC